MALIMPATSGFIIPLQSGDGILDMVNGELIDIAGASARKVPSGVTLINIEIFGGGQAGTASFFGGAGGKAGGYAIRFQKSVSPGDTIDFDIGLGGVNDSEAGADTTCDGMTATGGGTAGTTSGGEINVQEIGSLGETGGANPYSGATAGNGGNGGSFSFDPGFAGGIRFTWVSGGSDMSNGANIDGGGLDYRLVPAGVTSIDIEAWGAGGPGAGGNSGGGWHGGGGAGGGYCKRDDKSVSPGDAIWFFSADPGLALPPGGFVNITPPDGVMSYCDGMTAGGGQGGRANTTGSNGGPSTGGVASGGDTNTNGSNGTENSGGGSAGGTGGNSPNGGTGGAGATSGSDATAGGDPGGGGGGGTDATGGHSDGKDGGTGRIKFSFDADTVPGAFVAGNWTLVDKNTDGALTVTISALPDDGGSAITSIEYRVDGGSWTSSGLSSTGAFDITGLTNYTEYDVELRAVNAIGNGAAGDLKSATPQKPAITINNIQSATASATNTLNLNNYTVSGSINNRILVLMVSGESDPAGVTSMSVTFGGNAMTAATSFSIVGTTITAFAQIWYMLNPPTGTTDDFVVTLNGTSNEFAARAVVLGNAKQQAPTNANTFNATASPISSTLTVTPDRGMILDVIRCGNASNFTVTGTGHSAIGSEVDQASSTYHCGQNAFTSSGSKQISWTNSSVNRMAQAAAAFERN